MTDNNIEGRLVLITGASSGIGAATAHAFAHRGCHLALTYNTNLSAMDAVVASILSSKSQGTNGELKLHISTHKVDVGVVEDLERLFEEVKMEHKGKTVDVLVSNAGYGKRIVDVWDIPLSEFEYTINVNLRASFILVKGVIEGMKAQKWGRIIFMSSVAALGGGINGCHYAASKGGLSSMMRNLSMKLAPLNISVNDVSPGAIGDTGMLRSADVIPGGTSIIPMARLGKPEEVANVVIMLATTGYMTGQSLLIAGGMK